MEDIISHLEAVGRQYQELDQKIADKGGLGTFFGIYDRIVELFNSVNTSELESLVNEIQKTKEGLSHLQTSLRDISTLKEVYISQINSRSQEK